MPSHAKAAFGRRRAAAIAFALWLGAGTSRAGNQDSFLYGDQAALTGGAVVASSSDTAAIWYNPAGLARNQRNSLQVSGTAIAFRWRKIPDGLALDLPSERVQASIISQQFDVVPTTLAFARQIGDGLSVGFGLFVTNEDLYDFERSLQAADSSVNLDVAGALTGTLVTYHAGPSIGYQATRRLRIGASLFGVYDDNHEFRKLFANATTTGAYQSVFLQRLVDARTTRYGMELVAGAQFDAGRGWELGATARSPRLIFHESATTDNSTAVISTGTGVAPVTFSSVDHTPIGAEGTGFTRPPRFTAGASKHAGAFNVSAELDFSPAGSVPASANAIWNARSGVLWQAGEHTTLGLGFFTDRSGAATPASFPDYRVDYYGVSAGWKRTNSVELKSGHASTLVFSTTIAVRYALGMGESTRIRFDFSDAPATGQVGRVADELVNVVYHDASLYVGTGLDF
jgi:hypothetical protein